MLRAMNMVQKDQSKGQLLSDSPSDSCFSSHGLMHKARNTSLFSVPSLFVGFCTKGLSDCDAVRSPTSPLDYKGFPNLGSSCLGSPRSSFDGKPRCWDCNRVGLGLVDTLNDETKPPGKFLGLSESRNILFGPQMRSNISSPKSHLAGLRDDSLGAAPKSLPKDYGISSQFHSGSLKPQLGSSKMLLGPKGAHSKCEKFGLLRSCSVDLSRSSSPPTESMYKNSRSNSEVFPSDSKSSVLDSYLLVEGSASFDKFSGSLPISIASLSASEIEQSEDYTCIISHGPNPKTTHIFGDCILESHSFPSPDFKNNHRKDGEQSSWLLKPSEDSLACSTNDFLIFCFSCKKKLQVGEDIYMYRGEKAFCSSDCREQEILTEEEMEKPGIAAPSSPGSSGSSFHEEIFLEGMIMAA